MFSLAWALLTGTLVLTMRRPLGTPIELVPPPTPPPTPTPAPIRVYVSGAVQTPDVYPLPANAIVRDAIQAAGGPSPDAETDAVNLALPLSDGMQVYMPRKGEVAPPAVIAAGPVQAAGSGGSARVNINTATLEQLDTLPGIGAEKAKRIIEGRPYAAPEDLTNVSGIGEGTFAKLKDLITVR
jgi:competence protein ComEA